jgi:hypothetical protein
MRAKAPVVARLGAEVVEIVAPKKFDTPDALGGAKIDVGPEGSPQAATLAILFAKLGLHPALQHHPLDQALSLLQAGKLDAVAAMGAPTPSNVGDFGAKGDFHLVPVVYGDALKGLFLPAARSDHERPHLVASGEATQTVAAPIALVAIGEPDPDSAGDKAVKALFESFAAQSAPWNGPGWSDVNFAAQGVDWPRAKAVEAWLAAHQRQADPALAATRGDSDANGIYAALTKLRARAPEP